MASLNHLEILLDLEFAPTSSTIASRAGVYVIEKALSLEMPVELILEWHTSLRIRGWVNGEGSGLAYFYRITGGRSFMDGKWLECIPQGSILDYSLVIAPFVARVQISLLIASPIDPKQLEAVLLPSASGNGEWTLIQSVIRRYPYAPDEPGKFGKVA